jgi:nucleoside-diphosphate-sugar epimerase
MIPGGSMKRVLVTGSTGFVGQILCESAARAGYTVRAAVRGGKAPPPGASESVSVGDIGRATDWGAALENVDCIIHTAARAHVLRDVPAAAELYFETNERGTQALAVAAARAGVRRLVYVSSIKVNGEGTSHAPYTAEDAPCPQDAYGESKKHAEEALWEVSRRGDLEAVVVRPPLVYGPRVRANFRRLMSWVERGWPLPFGAVSNRRSLVSVWNLCDLLVHSLDHPRAAGRTWLVSDGEDVSTPELIRRIGVAMRRRVTLLPVPVPLLKAFAGLVGYGGEFARLCGSLAVDISRTRADLGWSPPQTLVSGLARTCEWYLQRGSSE